MKFEANNEYEKDDGSIKTVTMTTLVGISITKKMPLVSQIEAL